MNEKELLLGGNKKKTLKEVRFYYVSDNETMEALPAMPGFLELMKTGYFVFNFGTQDTLLKEMKKYKGEEKFVIYDYSIPFNNPRFQELADKSHEMPFEELILISPYHPETILVEESRQLLDKVSIIKRVANTFLIETESAESYFSKME